MLAIRVSGRPDADPGAGEGNRERAGSARGMRRPPPRGRGPCPTTTPPTWTAAAPSAGEWAGEGPVGVVAGRVRRAGPHRGGQDREAIHSAAAAGAPSGGVSTSGAIGSSPNRSPVRACEVPVVSTMVRPVYSGNSWLTEA